MIEFEKQARQQTPSIIASAISEFKNDYHQIFATQELRRRRDVARIAQLVMTSREPAWAAISVKLHEAFLTLQADAERFAALATPLPDPFGMPVLGYTPPAWLDASKSLEHQRFGISLRGALLSEEPLTEYYKLVSPFSKTPSSIAVLVTSTITGIINRVALQQIKERGQDRYRLYTSHPDKPIPVQYRDRVFTIPGPVGPFSFGDRTIPVPA